jgi:hypothetical protein
MTQNERGDWVDEHDRVFQAIVIQLFLAESTTITRGAMQMVQSGCKIRKRYCLKMTAFLLAEAALLFHFGYASGW